MTSVGIIISLFGTIYYLLLEIQGVPQPFTECIYFVWITLATVGYGDTGFHGSSLILIVTILVGTYLITRFIVLSAHVYARILVEQVYDLQVLNEMRRSLEKAGGHFLIFGDDRELINKIIQGLIAHQEVYLVSEDLRMLKEFKEDYESLKYIVAKPFRAETVDFLRPKEAKGAYLLYCEDEKNILLAAMLENKVRVISAFSGNSAAVPRFRRVGVEPISPHFSGGLKIVSTLIRPKSTEFLDRFLLPDDGVLEFKIVKSGETGENFRYVALGSMVKDKLDFSSPPERGADILTIGFRNPESTVHKIGRLDAPDLPLTKDRFLVMGGGTIGGTVIEELRATLREVTVIEPLANKIEASRRRFGEEGIIYIQGDGESTQYRKEEFDGVAICTPIEEKNFAIGLDFVGSRLLRVVRAVDDDMESHYHRIGAIPVFIGEVGSARMLREVTNKFVNEVLHSMLHQHYRIDQVYISKHSTMRELKKQFGVQVIALCRGNICYFGSNDDEIFHEGDTLIICGHVEANKKLRMFHLLES